MKYVKTVADGYILAIGTGDAGVEITEAEYNEILSVIRAKPARVGTTDYKLREDLTWEAFEVEPEPDIGPTEYDKAEAYDIMVGVES